MYALSPKLDSYYSYDIFLLFVVIINIFSHFPQMLMSTHFIIDIHLYNPDSPTWSDKAIHLPSWNTSERCVQTHTWFNYQQIPFCFCLGNIDEIRPDGRWTESCRPRRGRDTNYDEIIMLVERPIEHLVLKKIPFFRIAMRYTIKAKRYIKFICDKFSSIYRVEEY